MAPGRDDGPRGAVAFEARTCPASLHVADRIDQQQYQLFTDQPVEPTPTEARPFPMPVDGAVEVTTGAVELPTVVIVCVRDGTGEAVTRTEHMATEELPPGSYTLELNAPLRIDLAVESAVTIRADAERTHIEFGEETRVVVGARSEHTRPAATVTTTSDPADVMAAVSTFGSALKTTSPERAFPSFRGHPPAVELGDELDVPAAVRPPDTGVEVELPPTLRHAYVAAPLAYYLGATLVPGEEARLRSEAGLDVPLDAGDGFEAGVERVLKQVFLLDCVARTEGLYDVDFDTRRRVEAVADVDWAALYDAPLAERLVAYLDVSYERIAALVPEWKLTSHVAPDPTSVESLPYLVNDLAVVRTPAASDGVTAAESDPELRATVDSFLRGEDGFVRSAAESGPGVVPEVAAPENGNSLEHAWVGEATPLGMSKTTPVAYRNQLEREPTDGDIEITVVCNEPAMDDERGLVDEVYGSRDHLPFEVRMRGPLEEDELREELGRETDFLHYIGHIDERGFRCPDGHLDTATLASVGVDAFLLNACRSYDQGLGLIEAGAVGGITTLSDVPNAGAVEVGHTVARLLNCGFSIRAALEIAKDESVIGTRYLVTGNGTVTITQAESGTPQLHEVSPAADGDGYEVDIYAYPTTSGGMGELFTPFVGDENTYYLNAGHLDCFELSAEELAGFLSMENVPLRVDGELRWSYDVSVEDIRE